MNKYIRVYYTNGKVEEFYGYLGIGNKNILSISQERDDKEIYIPLYNILKYEVRR